MNLSPIDLADGVNVLVLAVAAFLAYIGQRNKNQINDQISVFREQVERKYSEFRDEVEKKYVPVKYDEHQHSTLAQRLGHTEEELKRNRDNIHQLKNDLTVLMMGKLDRIEQQIQDMSRRLIDVERQTLR